MTDLFVAIVLAGVIASLSYGAGVNSGRIESYRGLVVCEERLDGVIDCMLKKNVRRTSK